MSAVRRSEGLVGIENVTDASETLNIVSSREWPAHVQIEERDDERLDLIDAVATGCAKVQERRQ